MNSWRSLLVNLSRSSAALMLMGLMLMGMCIGLMAGRAEAKPLDPAASESARINLRYDNKRLSAEIDNIPLTQFLSRLAQQNGFKVKPVDPLTGAQPVSANLQAVPLIHGIKSILKDFSYVLYMDDDAVVIYVLPMRDLALKAGGAIAHSSIQDSKAVVPAEPDSPQSLDEYQALEFQGQEFTRPSSLDTALLDQALGALNSKHTDLYEEALDQLAVYDDTRAIEALTKAALGELGVGSDAQVRAATALSGQGLSNLSDDTTLTDALQQLTGSQNDQVRAIAVQALEAMRRQME